ncbi:2Fe-2S ferredoxin-type domain-containing protein [Butyriboletus roseoflavus]|nr:2Fe-2S ferredoxin-type domain-containing protein [Butyriboletus roseoflavus]
MTSHFSTATRKYHASYTRDWSELSPGSLLSITLHFKDHKGTPIKTIEANEGDDILSLAHEWDIDLEGACEGSIACSTCHIILPPEHYDRLPEPSDDENDMLDLAFGLTDTSRLGCQVHVTKNMDWDGDSVTERDEEYVRRREEVYASLIWQAGCGMRHRSRSGAYCEMRCGF